MRRFLAGSGLVVFLSSCGGAAPPPAAGHKQSVFASIATPAPKAVAPAPKEPPRPDGALLPRSVLFSNPERAMPMLSPDGKRIAYLSSVDGVLNVWVAPLGDLAKAKPVTQDKKRGIRTYRWAFTNDHV